MPITVITGPPGAGKTAVAGALARSFDRGVHLASDQFYRWIVSGYISPWSPQATAQNTAVIEAIGSAAGRYASVGYHVVLDGIVGPWFLDCLQQAAQVEFHELGYVILRPSRSTAMLRALARGDGELKDEEPIRLMYDVFENLGTFESRVVDSTEHDVAATVEIVAQGLTSERFLRADADRPDMDRMARLYAIPMSAR